MTHFEKYRSFVKNAYNMLYSSASFRVASLNNVKKCTNMPKNGVQYNKNNFDCDQRHLRHLSVTQLKHLNAECKAVLALIQRSQPNLISGLRAFHTSAPKHDKNVNEPRNDPNKKPNDDDKMGSVVAKAILWMLTGYIFITVLSMLFPGRQEQEHTLRYVSWNEFVYQMLAKGEVERVIVRPEIEHVTIVLYEGAIIKGRRIDHRTFQMSVVDVNKFEDKLRDAERMLGVKDEVPVIFERGADITGKLLISLFFAIFLLSFLSRSSGFKPPISMDTFTQMGRARFTLVDPVTVGGKGVYFKDVAGLHEAKQEVMEFVEYLKNPERYRRLGAKVPKGALLLGPPGCGKTLLAKAVATEAKVPFLSMNGSEFIEMIGGLGAARVRDLFKEGAKRSPCIIYIDEIDAIGRQRGGGGTGGGGAQTASGESEQTLNQLLVEMDGMATKEGVLMLASTNRADVLDKALLRPGRFDRHILIDFPNLSERTEIFAYHLSSIVLENPAKTYAKRLAIMTPGFSGADIANVCNEAALHAARFKATKVRGTDLEYAVERVVGGTEKRSHALSPGERRTVAYHEAGHALVGWLLEHTDALLKVTIVPRTTMALGFAMYTPNDQKLYSKEQLFERMCMALGGRVAESLTFNKITTGAQNDLEKVTKMAYAQIRQYGMSDAVGLVSFTDDEVSNKNKKPYSKVLAALMDAEVRLMVTQAYLKTESVLKENSDKLKLLAETLLKEETLNYKDVEKLIGPPPHGPKQMIGPEEFAQENVEEDKIENKQ